MAPSFNRIMRFMPKDAASADQQILIGEPESESQDVGKALFDGETVRARIYTGSSVLDAGDATESIVEVERVLSPLTQAEVGTIRCIGLNYKQHAAEAGMGDLPTVPTLFMKPCTSLGDPWPSKTPLSKLTHTSNTGDFESELAIIIGKDCKNVSESNVYEYILGYTAANDISNRQEQFAQSQWCFSKGFDGSCPIGPVIASTKMVPDPHKFRVRGIMNGEEMQNCGTDDLIFSVPRLVSFLSQGTTLKAGTVIVTGTPAGVGFPRKPKVSLKEGDRFVVEILPGIGSLVSEFENEK